MEFIARLTNYCVTSSSLNASLKNVQFTLSKGDTYSIMASLDDEARLLLRSLATLELPDQGTYHFKDQRLDFSDYRNLLPVKRKIGYIASDTALIRSLTVRENLMLVRCYFENSLRLSWDDSCDQLCNLLHVNEKLDRRPEDLNLLDYRMVVVVRELSKKPDVLLLERPEHVAGQAGYDHFLDHIIRLQQNGMPVVMISYDKIILSKLNPRPLYIKNSLLQTSAVNLNGIDQKNGDSGEHPGKTPP